VTLQDWYRVLEERPDDWDTRLVLADWCAEHEEPELEAVQRWLVEHRRHPVQEEDGHDWLLGTTRNSRHFLTKEPLQPIESFSPVLNEKWETAGLPHELWLALKRVRNENPDSWYWSGGSSLLRLEQALGKALAQVQQGVQRSTPSSPV